jgi:hypothetical protein
MISMLADRVGSRLTLSLLTVVCSSNRRSERVSGEITQMRTMPDIVEIALWGCCTRAIRVFGISWHIYVT